MKKETYNEWKFLPNDIVVVSDTEQNIQNTMGRWNNDLHKNNEKSAKS